MLSCRCSIRPYWHKLALLQAISAVMDWRDHLSSASIGQATQNMTFCILGYPWDGA